MTWMETLARTCLWLRTQQPIFITPSEAGMLSFARLDAVLLLEEPADIVIVLFTREREDYR